MNRAQLIRKYLLGSISHIELRLPFPPPILFLTHQKKIVLLVLLNKHGALTSDCVQIE